MPRIFPAMITTKLSKTLLFPFFGRIFGDSRTDYLHVRKSFTFILMLLFSLLGIFCNPFVNDLMSLFKVITMITSVLHFALLFVPGILLLAGIDFSSKLRLLNSTNLSH